MMLLDRMKEVKDLTAQEDNILNYIFQNPKSIFECSAKELATLTFTSPSTVVRLCKKLGTKGYPDFKLEFIKNFQMNEQILSTLSNTQTIKMNNTKDISEIIPILYNRIFNETKKVLNYDTLNYIIKQLKIIKRIDIYAEHINHYSARQICCKFDTLGISSVTHSGINLQYVNNISKKNKKETLSFIISYSGTNVSMLQIATVLKQNEFNTIAICGTKNDSLSKICNNTIYIYSDDLITAQSSVSHSISLEYIFDIILTKLQMDMSKSNFIS